MSVGKWEKVWAEDLNRLRVENEKRELKILDLTARLANAKESWKFFEDENIKLKTTLKNMKNIIEPVREIIRISDRNHEAWNKAKEVLAIIDKEMKKHE